MLFIGGDGGGDVACNNIEVSVRVVDISKVIRPWHVVAYTYVSCAGLLLPGLEELCILGIHLVNFKYF